MVKLIWVAFAVFVLIAIIKENGGIDGWIEPAKQSYKGPLITCSKLTNNAEAAACMSNNCLFDRPELNAPHCNAR